MSTPNFAATLEQFQKELLESIVPFWEKHSIDQENGGFYHSLDQDGSVFDTTKYMWMEWRIVYTFALLSTKYGNEKWLEIARRGFEFLEANGKSEDEEGFYCFALDKKGAQIIAPFSVYSEAFAAIGSSQLFRASGDEKYQWEAATSVEKYITRMSNPVGRWDKSLPARKRRHSLSLHMIFLNLNNVLKECSGTVEYDAKVEKSIDLIMNHFWDKEHYVFFENINEDYSHDFESSEGRHLNPGHGLECCWFLLQHAERNNLPELIATVSDMILALLERGWDKEHGGIYYFLDVLNKPKQELEWDMKLWWVHNEAMIAALYAYKLNPSRSEFWQWFEKIRDWSWAHFRDEKFGEWFGYLNRRGEPTNMLKGGRWKTFFHIPRALVICSDLLQSLIDQGK